MFKLVIADEVGTKTTVPLVRDEISIGRKEGNTIRLTERNISRTHAQLRRSDTGFLLRDLGSYNGVLVNGKRVDGEATIGAGDQIKLGDYMMAIESDQPVVAATTANGAVAAPSERAGTSSPIPPPPPVPTLDASAKAGRLVMLAGPTPGADYTLPTSGAMRVGRGLELDLPIEHRSVSREHVELRFDGSGARLIDLDSANGVRVNGSPSRERVLQGGDVIELGQVALRYVAPGDTYVFDPADAEPYARAAGNRLNFGLLAIGAVAIGAVAMLVFGGASEEDTTVTPLPPVARVTAVAAESPPELVAEEPAPAVDPFDGALAACRDAVTGERFAEAVAHATSALKARPEEVQAAECMAVAKLGHADEQSYVRGKAALQAGDADAALVEFAALHDNSPFADKPEVAEARRVADEAKRVEAARAAEAIAAVAAVKARPVAASARPAPSRPAPAPAAVELAPAGQSPFQVASACLARGDNQCVIRALTGKARTPQELGLLIETHRSLGNTDKATSGMEQYVKQFPTGPKASTYRRMLERQGQ